VLEELLCRQIGGLPPVEDRLDDIWREIAEADEPSEIGALTLSRSASRSAKAVMRHFQEANLLLPVRPLAGPSPHDVVWRAARRASLLNGIEGNPAIPAIG
jgi:hypothetical protein